MGTRIDLHTILCEIMKQLGFSTKSVYYQPPESLHLSYPCIVYRGSGGNTEYADNVPYIKKRRYQITVIDEDPDSKIPDFIGNLPYASYDTDYESDNLNHFVFNIYY